MKNFIIKGLVIEAGRAGIKGNIIDIKGVVLPKDGETFVQFDFSNVPIGTAKVYIENDVIKADVKLFYNDVAKKALFDFLTPALGGIVKERGGVLIGSCVMTGIGLCSTSNNDKEIKTIGEQVGYLCKECLTSRVPIKGKVCQECENAREQ